MPTPPAAAEPEPSQAAMSYRSGAFCLAQWAAYLAAWAIVLPVEISRWRDLDPANRDLFNMFVDLNIDSSPYLVWLLILPIFWFWPRRRRSPRATAANSTIPAQPLSIVNAASPPGQPRSRGPRWRVLAICLAVGLGSLANSVWIGSHFGNLPPAYHDEYSYLIQARTFAAGRLTYPSPPAPELFDQIHVLNLGKFASRYFPGTGAWLAPFLAAGHPIWGQWLASALAAVLFCLAGRELAGDFAGVLTGLLVAFSPGISIFSNLLLAHQPTLLGLGLFLFAWLRMMNSKSWRWAIVCGTGLTFAMLCRPLTAAAVGLPFGAWLLLQGIVAGWREPSELRRWMGLWLGVGAPLAIGLIAMFAYNQAVTGDGWLTPYSQYTSAYTPRHVFGFNNVEKGASHVGPRVMESYDLWAENLTPELAARNAYHRVLASGQWTLGLIPLAMSLVAGLFLCRKREAWLVLAAIAGLHVAHIPYWFVGIMNWHYVFESAPLWCLWFAMTSTELIAAWRSQGRGAVIAWWGGLLLIATLTSYVPIAGLWNQCRVGAAIGEIKFPRERYASFAGKLNSLPPNPGLVLIEGDPADRSFDLVVNNPEFQDRIIRGRLPPKQSSLTEVKRLFPNRRVYRYRVRNNQFERAD